MKCGFCKAEGHTISKCKAPGIDEERERRKSDPKEVERKEKSQKKREEKQEEERKRLGITKEKKGLHQPVIQPGHIELEFRDAAETVEGAINLVLPESYMQKILMIINENQYQIF